jgi:tetratricopeptide (TPR) repeat protein
MCALVLVALLGVQAPDSWDVVVTEAYRLRAEEKPAAAAALLERALATAPRGDGHFLLALVYEDLARAAGASSPPDEAGRRARLTQAVAQFTRALALVETDMQFPTLFKLVELHRSSGLDQPAEAASFAARLVEVFPTRAEAYVLHGQVLHEQGRLAAAVETMRQGRARVPDFPAIAHLNFVRYVVEHVEAEPGMPRPAARAALDEGLAAMDGLLATASDTQSPDYHLATFARKVVLRTMAERAEDDPARKAALLAEADESGPSSAGEPLAFVDVPTGPAEAGGVDLLERTLLDVEARATAAWDAGRHDEAVQVLADFADAHPDYARAHMSLGYRHGDRAALSDGPTAAQRSAHLQLAAAAFERALAVSQPIEVMYAVEHLVSVYGPDGLKQPALALTAVREGTRRAPRQPRTHGLTVRALLDAGQESELTAAFDAARAAIAPDDDRVALANEYLALVGTATQSRSANTRLVQEADALIDAALARDADALFALATKEWALRERAARVEPDAALAKALVEEADRVAERVKVLRAARP